MQAILMKFLVVMVLYIFHHSINVDTNHIRIVREFKKKLIYLASIKVRIMKFNTSSINCLSLCQLLLKSN